MNIKKFTIPLFVTIQSLVLMTGMVNTAHAVPDQDQHFINVNATSPYDPTQATNGKWYVDTSVGDDLRSKDLSFNFMINFSALGAINVFTKSVIDIPAAFFEQVVAQTGVVPENTLNEGPIGWSLNPAFGYYGDSRLRVFVGLPHTDLKDNYGQKFPVTVYFNHATGAFNGGIPPYTPGSAFYGEYGAVAGVTFHVKMNQDTGDWEFSDRDADTVAFLELYLNAGPDVDLPRLGYKTLKKFISYFKTATNKVFDIELAEVGAPERFELADIYVDQSPTEQFFTSVSGRAIFSGYLAHRVEWKRDNPYFNTMFGLIGGTSGVAITNAVSGLVMQKFGYKRNAIIGSYANTMLVSAPWIAAAIVGSDYSTYMGGIVDFGLKGVNEVGGGSNPHGYGYFFTGGRFFGKVWGTDVTKMKTSALIPSVEASPMLEAKPDGYDKAKSAYNDGSWETYARLFRHGTPIGDDFNFRKYTFANDHSYATIQAYDPKVLFSDDSNMTLTAGLTNVYAGATFASLRPYDAAWQGYEIKFFKSNHIPIGSYYFYGWKRSQNPFHEVSINKEHDSHKFINFADYLRDIDWYKWKSGSASKRVYKTLLPVIGGLAAPIVH